MNKRGEKLLSSLSQPLEDSPRTAMNSLKWKCQPWPMDLLFRQPAFSSSQGPPIHQVNFYQPIVSFLSRFTRFSYLLIKWDSKSLKSITITFKCHWLRLSRFTSVVVNLPTRNTYKTFYLGKKNWYQHFTNVIMHIQSEKYKKKRKVHHDCF